MMSWWFTTTTPVAFFASSSTTIACTLARQSKVDALITAMREASCSVGVKTASPENAARVHAAQASFTD